MNAHNIVFKSIGDKSIFRKSIFDLLVSAEKLTMKNSGMKLNICLNYGGISDIIVATKLIAENVAKNQLDINDIDEKYLRKHLLFFRG